MGGCGSSNAKPIEAKLDAVENMEPTPTEPGPPSPTDEQRASRPLEKGALRRGSSENIQQGEQANNHTSDIAAPDPESRKFAVFRDVFAKYDEDNSGEIDSDELKAIFEELGWDHSDQAVTDALKILDEDTNGTIELEEFLRWSDMSKKRMLAEDIGHTNAKLPSINTSTNLTATSKLEIVEEKSAVRARGGLATASNSA